MKYFVYIVETLGQVLTLATSADTEQEAYRFCCESLKDSTGRWIYIEISEDTFERLIKCSSTGKQKVSIRFRNPQIPILDIVDKESTVYMIASGKIEPQRLFGREN